jgi:hypothetical protein
MRAETIKLSYKWFEFVDQRTAHSGRKTDYDIVFVRATFLSAAKAIFREVLRYDPDCRSCRCCGPDFAVYEHEGLRSNDWTKADPKHTLVIE